MTDPREAKLPKWAQDLLRKERFERNRSEEKLAAYMRQQVKPTPIWYGTWQNPIFLPDTSGYQRVHFQMNGTNPKMTTRDDIQVGIKHNQPNTLEIMGGDRIVISPSASNVVEVQLIR